MPNLNLNFRQLYELQKQEIAQLKTINDTKDIRIQNLEEQKAALDKMLFDILNERRGENNNRKL